jgi:hypothetical protein
MEPALVNHHAALTRNLPLRPLNDASHFTRHDPMRLPDVHMRRADSAIGAVGRKRVPISEQQTMPVWNTSGISSQWNAAFGSHSRSTQPSLPAGRERGTVNRPTEKDRSGGESIKRVKRKATRQEQEDHSAAVVVAGAPGDPNSGNHIPPDYRMQLMLLEQQNKKRLLMARLEHDSMMPLDIEASQRPKRGASSNSHAVDFNQGVNTRNEMAMGPNGQMMPRSHPQFHMPPQTPVGPQEVNQFRQRIPNAHAMTDDQIRVVMEQSRQRGIADQNAALKQAQMQNVLPHNAAGGNQLLRMNVATKQMAGSQPGQKRAQPTSSGNDDVTEILNSITPEQLAQLAKLEPERHKQVLKRYDELRQAGKHSSQLQQQQQQQQAQQQQAQQQQAQQQQAQQQAQQHHLAMQHAILQQSSQGQPGPQLSGIPPQQMQQQLIAAKQNQAQAHSSGPRSGPSGSGERLLTFCQTVSRDETATEDARIFFHVKMALKPHTYNAQVMKI